MSEQTNAVERAARVYTETLAGRAFTDDEWAATRSQAEVEAMCAALTAAMPTTTTEWGVRWAEGDEDVNLPQGSREAAEKNAAAMRFLYSFPEEIRLVSREVTEWREVAP